MSSAPAEPEAPKKRRSFEPWRKVMLLGAFILLGQALFVALSDSTPPQWAAMFLNFVGYGFLVAGFAMRMRERKEEKDTMATPDRSEQHEGSDTGGPDAPRTGGR